MPGPSSIPDIYELEWSVDQAGYDLVEPTPGGQSLLEQATPGRRIVPRGGPRRYYLPLSDYPALCREFAAVAGDAAALEFVRKFGELSSAQDHYASRIVAEAQKVARVLAIYDENHRADAAAEFNNIGANSMRLYIVGHATKTFEPLLRPADLQSAIWKQVADTITGRLEYIRCKNCQAWMRIGSETREEITRGPNKGIEAKRTVTRGREFCSHKCRTAFQRRADQPQFNCS